MNSGDDLWFSALQLSLLAKAHAIKFPRNEKNARIKARHLNWESREVECQGGRGGVRAEFKPPKDILADVQEYLKNNPDFLNKRRKKSNEDEPSAKPYPVSTATVLKIKSPEPASMFDTLNADLFIYVSIAVHKMLEKTGKQLDTDKRNDLIQLIYEYCKMRGECDDEIISKFLNVAG